MKLRTNWRDGAHFDDAAAGTGAGDAGAAAAAAAAAASAKPWYDGKLDAEAIGYAQNKSWKLDDPATFAVEAFKAAREAQKFVGVPPEQLVRLPKDPNDAGWKDVWGRLGAPKDPNEYDFSAVKTADGKDIDPALADAIRATAFANHTPKETAAAIAAALVKHQEGQQASRSAEMATKLAAEKAELQKEWGPNFDHNKLTAQQGAKRLGIAPEALTAMENQVGYKAVMEAMRKIGAGTTEDTFVEGKGGGSPATIQAAVARKAELMADKLWADRFLKGDAAAKREMAALDQQIAGVVDVAA